MAKGWRTLGFSLFIAVLGVAQVFDWATIIPDSNPAKGTILIGIGAIIAGLRTITTTSIGKQS